MDAISIALSEEDLRRANYLLNRGLCLEYMTLGWNVVGFAIIIWAGLIADSVALVGFALDSLVEIGASSVVIWQLTGASKLREMRALRLIGTAFFVLSTYILTQSLQALLSQAHPNQSIVGTAWLAATFITMLLLAWGKEITGKQLGNQVLRSEARVTLVDAYLAGAVLLGLVLNGLLGLWWADPAACLHDTVEGARNPGEPGWKDYRMDEQSEIYRLIDELDSLKAGEHAGARLIAHGPAAIEPLRRFLREGRPRKLVQLDGGFVGNRSIAFHVLCGELLQGNVREGDGGERCSKSADMRMGSRYFQIVQDLEHQAPEFGDAFEQGCLLLGRDVGRVGIERSGRLRS